MQIMNTERGYGVPSRVIHWATALLLVSAFLLGQFIEEAEGQGGLSGLLLQAHASVGILVLALTALRLLWKPFAGRVPAAPDGVAWQRVLASLVRVALWVSLLGLPLSGWAMLNAEGYIVEVFGGLPLPVIAVENHGFAEFVKELHETLVSLLIFSLLLHLAGAFKHLFSGGQSPLRRMPLFGQG